MTDQARQPDTQTDHPARSRSAREPVAAGGAPELRSSGATEERAEAEGAKVVAAIDIGSNSVRMEIGEVLPDGDLRVLERLQRAVRLGQDTFRRGRLGRRTMHAAISILRDDKQMLDFYQVQRVRAVATSAVREADNADTFLDRLFMATGLEVEIIDTAEESRLTVSAVRQGAGGSKPLSRARRAMIVDVGGGSTLLTVLNKGQISVSQGLRLGSIRLQESLLTGEETPPAAAELIRQQAANTVHALQGSLPLKEIETFVAVGGDARFAADQATDGAESRSTGDRDGFRRVSRDRFDALVERVVTMTPDDLTRAHGIAFALAETLGPALLVYQQLFRATAAESMLVSDASMRDGLLLDLAREVTGQQDETLTRGVVHSAMGLARKYCVDMDHARAVAEMAVDLFDQLAGEHGLGRRHRLLLRVAALLHEVGGFVSSRAHHKHSLYLISNTEVFGLTRGELQIVAHVARYHRRSAPKPSHTEFMALPREDRIVVSKLAALLRVADALDRTHGRAALRFTCVRQGEELAIRVHEGSDLTLERRALAEKADLFEDLHGLIVRLEEASDGPSDLRRAEPMI